jgi:hypothetical protein
VSHDQGEATLPNHSRKKKRRQSCKESYGTPSKESAWPVIAVTLECLYIPQGILVYRVKHKGEAVLFQTIRDFLQATAQGPKGSGTHDKGA